MLSLCLSACLGLSGLRLVPLGTPVATPVPVPRLGLIRLAVDEKPKVGNGLFEGLSRRAGRAAAPATPSEECVTDSEMSGGVAAASALVSSAIIAEGVQIVGTAVLLYLGQRWTGTETPVEAVSALIEYIQSLGVQGYALFSALMISLQVVPIAAAFVLTVSAGAIFGAVKGTAVVLSCSTASATISFYISRTLGRERLLDYAQKSPQFRAIDTAFGEASFGTALTLITLLRLSPVLPFAWANYIFGLSPVSPLAFTLGTFGGCLPAVAGYVTAGQLGAEIAVNGADTPPQLLILGVAATLVAITVAGNIASSALKDMDLDLEGSS